MVDIVTLGAALALMSTKVDIDSTGKIYHVRVYMKGQDVPIKDVYITVSAPRLKKAVNDVGNGTQKTAADIGKFGGGAGGGGDVKNVVKSTAGATEDSSGQIHVRGEHTSITYVIDGTPLPDTLSGRQGAIVVPATIDTVDILLGGFAPEYGIQTAAILDIATLGRVKSPSNDLSVGYGQYGGKNIQLTSLAPLGEKLSFVINLAHDQTLIASEAQQPINQDAHNRGENQNFYAKFDYQASARDRLTLTVSANPSALQIGNRTGLPSRFADVGQGFGYLGNRNADGTLPGSGLGSQTMVLPSQEADGMDINDRELNDFALLGWRHQFDEKSYGQISFTILHAGQDITNNNPLVTMTNLPVDNSIEFNPTAARNIHHAQVSGSFTTKSGSHTFKVGGIYDKQSGQESYQITPASQLALDGLYSVAPILSPAGSLTGQTDVNGNPIYLATSNSSPTLYIARDGYYAGAYVQDTWKLGPKTTLNYGFRFDHFNQSENLSPTAVDQSLISPRLNFSTKLDGDTTLRASYNKLFNTPPLAQGAIIGQPLQPEIIDQYDLSVEKQLSPYQTFKMAYYAKQIQNQVDVGLLLPGSEVGLYTGVNFDQGGIHGLEFSYESSAPKGIGWDGFANYTYSQAAPNGLDNTGAAAPDFNDHDQRSTISAGLSYTYPSGASAALTFTHGSGLASSTIPPSLDRITRSEWSAHFDSGDRLFKGKGGLSLDINNIFDDRGVINFQSGFSGTRFQTGRVISMSAHYKF